MVTFYIQRFYHSSFILSFLSFGFGFRSTPNPRLVCQAAQTMPSWHRRCRFRGRGTGRRGAGCTRCTRCAGRPSEARRRRRRRHRGRCRGRWRRWSRCHDCCSDRCRGRRSGGNCRRSGGNCSLRQILFRLRKLNKMLAFLVFLTLLSLTLGACWRIWKPKRLEILEILYEIKQRMLWRQHLKQAPAGASAAANQPLAQQKNLSILLSQKLVAKTLQLPGTVNAGADISWFRTLLAILPQKNPSCHHQQAQVA